MSDLPRGSNSSCVAATRASRRPCSRRRVWLLRTSAVFLGFLPFVVLELVLRIFGYGFDTHLIIRVPSAPIPSLHSLNPAIDRAYYGRGDLPGPEPRPFLLPKPAGVYRIVVVGGSSVAGFPYPFELSFPRHLEVVLREQNPGRQFEVLNAGIVAITSFSEVDIARQATECSPDLIIVHSGHNEFYGVGGLASTAGGVSTPLYPLLEQIRRQRIFQLCESFVAKPADKHLLEVLPADIAIPLEGTTFTTVQNYYRANLDRIAREAASTHVPLLLTTIPANLRDLSPMSSLRNASLTPEQEQQQAERNRKFTEHMSYNEYDKAILLLEVAREVDPSNALLAYREAQCLEKLQRNDEAGRAYMHATDADGCRFRAPSHFAAMVRDTATRHAPTVSFCDVAERLHARSQFPAAGNDFFLEHVHYNIDGHWNVALILGEFIQTEVLHSEWKPQSVPDTARRDELLGLTLFDDLMADTIALSILQVWPLKLAPDVNRQVEFFTERLRNRYASLTPLDQSLFADLSLLVMQHDLMMAMGTGYQRAGELEKALKMFEAGMVRRPWDARGYEHAAAVLQQQGQPQRAAEVLEKQQRLVRSARHIAKQGEKK